MSLLISICRDLFIALLAFALMLSWGCISTSQLKKQKQEQTGAIVGSSNPANSEASKVVPNPEFWYLQEASSTYFPVGLPNDFPASAGNSEWFPMEAGNFLIPLAGANGRSHTELLEQAIKEQSDAEILGAKSRKAAEIAVTVGNPVNWVVAGCMAQGN